MSVFKQKSMRCSGTTSTYGYSREGHNMYVPLSLAPLGRERLMHALLASEHLHTVQVLPGWVALRPNTFYLHLLIIAEILYSTSIMRGET
jgi:hypothetical protein